MSEPSEKSIADRGQARLAWRLAAAAVLWGIVAAIVYWQQELTLSHYDAKGHLVVARRVIDSLTPGWLQLGAVWLPLPHVLNLLPVQVDAWYRTGASGVAISLAGMALLVYSTSRLIMVHTGSRAGAILASTAIVTNPNLLYLQATPMTEPLLLGLLAWTLWRVTIAVEADTPHARRLASCAIALAMMTRYEAWPFSAALLALVPLARWHAGGRLLRGLVDALSMASVPAVAVLWFLIHSKVTVGAYFVTGGFYVPDPAYQHKALAVTGAVWWGLRQLGSEVLARSAAAAALVLVIAWWRRRLPSSVVLTVAWIAVAALPWYAFFQGHPLRIRYMVPLVVAAAVIAGLAIGALKRGQWAVAALLLGGIWWTTRPYDAKAAMVLEAQWDRPRSVERQAVSACLPAPGGSEIVMASMGSLAHYMQELSARGFELRDFLHEGNGDLWLRALRYPREHVRWILIEEVAEGGDMLAERARREPEFLAGFRKVCEGGGVALYKAQ
jgi:hypothetical protein